MGWADFGFVVPESLRRKSSTKMRIYPALMDELSVGYEIHPLGFIDFPEFDFFPSLSRQRVVMSRTEERHNAQNQRTNIMHETMDWLLRLKASSVRGTKLTTNTINIIVSFSSPLWILLTVFLRSSNKWAFKASQWPWLWDSVSCQFRAWIDVFHRQRRRLLQ